jgi:hypothetical protein
MKFNFPSIAHSSKYGYSYDSSAWNGTETNSSFRIYETYGDGLCQHSGDWCVTLEYLADYLASLATAMLPNEELTREVLYVVTRHPDRDKIDFAASVVWKESDNDYGKRRYYSIGERKIKGRAAQYDTRYKEINKYQDGSRASIFGVLVSDYADGLERFQIWDAIRDWAGEQKKDVPTGERAPEWFPGEYAKLSRLRRSLAACRYIAQAYQLRLDAESNLEHYNGFIKVDAEEKAASTSATEAA